MTNKPIPLAICKFSIYVPLHPDHVRILFAGTEAFAAAN